ncbi:MAG: adenylate/guanylate cyclase domain-containing protein [Caldilineales bacterium]
MTSFQPDPATTPDIPVGTVTFLFTDVEGSTQLLARLRDRYTELLAEHHRLLREIFARWGGREIGTQGDSFFVAFPRAGDAICAVVEAQRGFADHQWPEDTEVRAAWVCTPASPGWWPRATSAWTSTAARIAHAGHGGQVALRDDPRWSPMTPAV